MFIGPSLPNARVVLGLLASTLRNDAPSDEYVYYSLDNF